MLTSTDEKLMFDTIKKYLLEVEEKVKLNELPSKIYHATETENLESIAANGLLESKMSGIYFCLTPGDLEAFSISTRLRYMSIVEVDTSQLDISFLRWSTDHNTDFIPVKALVYLNDIKPIAVRVYEDN